MRLKLIATAVWILLPLVWMNQPSGRPQLFAQQSIKTQTPRQIEVRLDRAIVDQPLSGRLLVFFSSQSNRPIAGPDWFRPQPFFAIDVKSFAPGSSLTIDDQAEAFPHPLSEVPAGSWFVQAILDRDVPHDFPHPTTRPGNVFSQAQRIEIKDSEFDSEPLVELVLDQVVKPLELTDTHSLRFVEYESSLLSEFHGRPIVDRCAVVLPSGYNENPGRHYPVKYEVTGFGANMNHIRLQYGQKQVRPDANDTFIHVLLTGECEWGHHVYANSETNGPRGDALVRELIPLIDTKFRTIDRPSARLLTGHSSGGWATLWLQIQYPEMFGGVWSTAPDPVDFRDFQQINLYDPAANFFMDEDGSDRPLARRGDRPMVWYRDFSAMEDVLGPGGQLRSFEAVFSSLDNKGLPAKCWDRSTGAVNADVARQWQRFDISRFIRQHGQHLQNKLANKIHIHMGTLDTFYLNGAVPLLADRLAAAMIPATIEMHPGKDHFNLMTPELAARIFEEMRLTSESR